MLARGLACQARAARLSLQRPPLVQRLVSTVSRTNVAVPRSVLAAAAPFTIVGAATKYAWSMPLKDEEPKRRSNATARQEAARAKAAAYEKMRADEIARTREKKQAELWPQTFNCFECGKEGRLRKEQAAPPPPQRVRCFTHRASATTSRNVMKMDAAEEAADALRTQEHAASMAQGNLEASAEARRAHVATIVEARPRPSARSLAAANAELAEQIEEGLRRDDMLTHGNGRTCPCNCAISLEAKERRPAVFKTFQYLCGATPARTNDICAMPKSWLEHMAAVWGVLHEQYPGQVDPYAFVGLESLKRAASGRVSSAAWYGAVAEAYDDDEGGRDLPDEIRVSIVSDDLSEMLLPYSCAKPDRDALGRIENKTVGHAGHTISRFPVELAGRKTVMTVMSYRRQFTLPSIDFHPVNDVWSPRMTAEFEHLARLAVPATIHQLIKTSTTDGEAACKIVRDFQSLYAPILDAIDVLLRRKYQCTRAVLL